jgi:hypothetical protein
MGGLRETLFGSNETSTFSLFEQREDGGFSLSSEVVMDEVASDAAAYSLRGLAGVFEAANGQPA